MQDISEASEQFCMPRAHIFARCVLAFGPTTTIKDHLIDIGTY